MSAFISLPRLKRLALAAGLGAALLALGWFGRAPLLRGVASGWTVEDALQPADAILVLGGGLETRPFAAARLYHAGYASNLVIFNVLPAPSEALGITKPSADLTTQVLLAEGVPAGAILTIGANVSSSYEEARAVRHWVDTAGVQALILPTEFPCTRRMRWTFNQALRGSGVRLMIQALDSWDYARTNWWRKEQGLIAFQNEVIKYAYYRLKY